MTSKSPFVQAERAHRAAAFKSLANVEIVDQVSDDLGRALQQLSLPDEGHDSPVHAQLKATLYLGVQAGRSLRAILGLLKLGYQQEAFVFLRRLREAYVRVERVTHPERGRSHAINWLEGKDGSSKSVLSELDRKEPRWKRLNHTAHADHRGVEEHLYYRDPQSGKGVFSLLPMRDDGRADAVLAYSALLTYNITGRIAAFHELDPGEHEAVGYDLDAALEALPDSPWAAGADEAGEPGEQDVS